MNKIQVGFLAIVVLAACGLSRAEDEKHVVRFGGVFSGPTGSVEEQGQFSEPLGDGTILFFDGTARTEADSALGFGIDYEYRWSDLLGFSLSASSVRHDVELHLGGDTWLIDEITGELLFSGPINESGVVGDVSATPVTLGVHFHLNNGGRSDIYAGPLLAFVLFGDLDVEGESTSFQNDFTYGVVFGIDIPFRDSPWSFNGKLQYLDATADIEDSAGGGELLSLRPVSLQLGTAYRF
jgi:hypothetical protein